MSDKEENKMKHRKFGQNWMTILHEHGEMPYKRQTE